MALAAPTAPSSTSSRTSPDSPAGFLSSTADAADTVVVDLGAPSGLSAPASASANAADALLADLSGVSAPAAFSTLEWRDLTFDVPAGRRSTRRVLNGISGSVAAGEMLAILGSSGAGKTTLLNCLSGRISSGTPGGHILLDGHPRQPRLWRRQAAFVEQDDVLHADLTVRETIEYAARLRLPAAALPPAAVRARAEAVLRALRLAEAADTRVGDSLTRGISGGERKRTAIAQEFVTMPQILFLDEPTSGLDSNTSLYLMEIVKTGVVATGRSAVATLHQPSWELLTLFDKIVLLSAGSTVFLGPPADALPHFARLGYTPRLNQNPADFFMDLLTIDSAKDKEGVEGDSRRVNELVAAFSSVASPTSEKPEKLSPLLESSSADKSEVDVTAPAAATAGLVATSPHESRWPNSWSHEATTLTERAFKQLVRARATLIAAAVRTIIMVVLIGFTYFRLARDARGVTDRFGILFFWPINMVLMNLLPVVTVFPTERAIMRRERAAGAYRTSAFFVSRYLTEVATSSLWTLLGSTPLYFMLGLRTDDGPGHFFLWLLIQWAIAMAALGYGFVIAVLVPTLQVGQVVAPLIALVFMIFGGGIVSNADTRYPFKVFSSLVALSLILALLQFKPAPMYILDEVDSALDESHKQNIGQLLRSRICSSQFVLVPVMDGLYSNANVLFRTRFRDGVSTVERHAQSYSAAPAPVELDVFVIGPFPLNQQSKTCSLGA
ncbi:ATP-binding cassette sub- G member 2 [Cladochytrium tenue]|nr:ATP-binding cassette sub- G member 2 [Cladochytrium tenue]